jgi:hypothetical protein
MIIVLQERDINIDRLTDPRERSRMGNFIHLVNTVFQYQSRLDAGEIPEMRVTNEAGILTGTMPITHLICSLHQGKRQETACCFSTQRQT